MLIRMFTIPAVLLLVCLLCGEIPLGVNSEDSDEPHHHHNHHGHKVSKPQYETWQERVERDSIQPLKIPPKEQENGAERRGIYFVVKLDESPPPETEGNVRKRRAVDEMDKGEDEGGMPPKITDLSVDATISNRFATTNIKSVLGNPGGTDKEGQFVVQIPEKAFISNFTMLIDGKLFIGVVKEKALAEKEYEEAKKRKETAGKVSSTPRTAVQPARGMEVFSVSVNVAASSSVEFVLTYQQLLERKSGLYTHIISIRPNQVVKDLKVVINVFDSQDIKFLNISMNGTEPIGQAQIQHVTEKNKKITYMPDEETQMSMDKIKGVTGDLRINYDVVHPANDAGMVCVDGEYFIHYFSPTGLDPLNKNVVFVIDISGSMAGHKIEQTLTAMKAILDILRSGDMFKLILFQSELVHWPKEQKLIPAIPDNIYSAKKFLLGELKASGSTNINDALVEACRTLNRNSENVWGSNIIVFLTDGQPTAGETNANKIVDNVVREANNKVSVFSLGFGNKYELDFNLLKKISYRTGVAEGAIRIYPGLEADEQLKQFFTLVNTPLLYNIKIEYPVDIVIIDSVTQNEFPQYFEGSELIVAGKINPNNVLEKMSVVVGGSTTMEVKYKKDIDLSESCPVVSRGYAQRLYAYMKIKYLLIQADKSDDKKIIDQIKSDALQLALDYNLVTPLTSMIVVQQVQEQNSYYEEDYEGLSRSASSSFSGAPTLGASSLNIVLLLLSYVLSSIL